MERYKERYGKIRKDMELDMKNIDRYGLDMEGYG